MSDGHHPQNYDPHHDADGTDPDGADPYAHPHTFADPAEFGGDPSAPDSHHGGDYRTPFEDFSADPGDPLQLLISEMMQGTDADAVPITPDTATHAASAAAAANLVRVGQTAQASRAVSAADMDVPDADEEDERHEEYIGVGAGLFLPLGDLGIIPHAPAEQRGLRVSDVAWNDLRAAARAITTQYGPASAEQFLLHLEAVLNALRLSPAALGTPRPPADFNHDPDLTHLYVYYVSTGPYPCDIFYRCLPDPDGPGPERARAEILRILHGSVEQPWLFPDSPLWDGEE